MLHEIPAEIQRVRIFYPKMPHSALAVGVPLAYVLRVSVKNLMAD